MAEIQTAEASDGSIKVQSPQSSGSDSETTGTVSKQQLKPRSKPKVVKGGFNERGIPRQNWDNPKADPNLRSHIGDDPTGETNVID